MPRDDSGRLLGAHGVRHDLRETVLERLGLGAPPACDIAGLQAVYAAWCQRVPFDNVRKLIALRTDPPATPLPGLDSSDFFATWRDHGAGGTCWASSNALHGLLRALGFDARRIAGSMRDTGLITHGSVLVHIGDDDWLVDTSMLTEAPLPVRGVYHLHRDDPFVAEIEPLDGAMFLLWTRMPSSDSYLPCRFLVDPDTYEAHVERYALSRHVGGFNQRVYARRNRDGEQWMLSGPAFTVRSASGIATRELAPGELIELLHDEFGMSDEILTRFIDCGALVESYAPLAVTPPPLSGLPPSLR